MNPHIMCGFFLFLHIKFILHIIFSLVAISAFAQGKRFQLKVVVDKMVQLNSNLFLNENKLVVTNNQIDYFGYITNDHVQYLINNKDTIANIWTTPGYYELLIKSINKDTLPLNANVSYIKQPQLSIDYNFFVSKKTELDLKYQSFTKKEDSVTKFFTEMLWNYALRVKDNEILKHFVYQLPQNYFSKQYIKKLSVLQKNKQLSQQQQQQFLLQKGTVLQDFNIANSINLHSLKSKYYLIDFWASWCGPCRRKHPFYEKLYNTYHANGFEIISISLDKDVNTWNKALEKDNMNWLNKNEKLGWQSVFVKKYGIYKLPFNILLNQNFEIITTDASLGVIEAFLKEL